MKNLLMILAFLLSSFALTAYAGSPVIWGPNGSVLVLASHLKTIGATPTATVNAHAGTGGACTVSHLTDLAGTMAITTTSSSPASGEQCKVNFNTTYGVAPTCVISPANAATAALMVSSQVYVTSSVSIMSVNYGVADATGHSVSFTFHCFETQ